MSMTEKRVDAVSTARDYYNSEDADNFYHRIWGGEDIHIGLYEYESEPVFDASRRTVAYMADSLGGLDRGARVIDLGAGYGGAARYLAATFGCNVVALNLSEVENARNREKNRAQGLDHLIDVVDGSFEGLPFPDGAFDVVWSQDAFLHSGNREAVISEAARVLAPGGRLIFTDPMQSAEAPEGVLEPILARIHLDSLGSTAFYRDCCARAGLEEIGFEDCSQQLPRHYARILAELEAKEPELEGIVSRDYRERMKTGLRHWVDGGAAGHLCWGIFRFRKP